MRSRSLVLLGLLTSLLLPAVTATAQRVGNYTLFPNSSTVNLAPPNTVIDLNSPVDAAGQIGTVVIRSNRSSCENGFKVKFFHRDGNTVTAFAERGPFNVTGALTTVQLTPPVAVSSGDLLGIVQLRDCTGTVGQTPILFEAAAHFEGDISTGEIGNSFQLLHYALAAYGAENASAEIRTQVLVVAGAATGVNNAQFRTDVFITTPRQTATKGRLVYHPEATTGVSTNPSVPFDVQPTRSRTLTNIIGTNLGLAGKGSIDVYTQIGFEPPNVSARVYEDSGAAGTKGFSFDALTLREALEPFTQGVLFAPQDTARFRMNVGIRTLDQPNTEIQFLAVDANGFQRAFVTKTFPANYYIQTDLRSLLDGAQTQAGDTIIVYPVNGPVFVYGSIIDNITNDPSLQFAKSLQ